MASNVYTMGPCQFEAESRYLTLQLPDSTPLCEDVQALRDRMNQDGFLFLRGLHSADAVMEARRDILQIMARQGKLDPRHPFEDAVAHPDPNEIATSSVRGRESLKTESLRKVVYGEPVMRFFDRFLGGKSISFNFQWLRTTGPGAESTIHYDVVYMGRGTDNLYTCWTPLGPIPPEMGPLAICLRSHSWQHVRQTYGRTDVDRDRTCGYFSTNPAELVDKFGGRWATTVFEPGDAVVLSMHIMHASLTNTTRQYRISCDTRYQLASDPVDDRWAGPAPRMHDAFWDPETPLESLEVSRRRWRL